MIQHMEVVRQKNGDELSKRLLELHKELYSLRVEKVSGQLKAPHRFRSIRKEIARIHTHLKIIES